MSVSIKKSILTLLLTATCTGISCAATIYPIDNTKLLAGAKFDLKVEFNEVVKPESFKLTINGKDYQQVLGKKGELIQREDGKEVSAFWVRDVSLPQGGKYVINAAAGNDSGKVNWNAVTTGARKAKNVIFFIGDGLTVAHRTGARILSKGFTQGKANGRMTVDDFRNMAFIGTSGMDSIATDSANSMSAYMTGHKTAVNAMGVYASRSANNLEHPKQETLAEILKRSMGLSIGIVSDAEVQDATPAAVISHTRRRSDKDIITEMFYAFKPDVLMGGGSAFFLPQSVPGSKRKDDKDFIKAFQNDGYTLVTSAQELNSQAAGAKKLLGLFNTGNMDGVLDRRFLKNDVTKKFPDQPDLTEMTKSALNVLEKNDKGFFLMVESALIDKASHPLDWERAFYNTIMMDQAIKVAVDFAKTHPDTLIIATGDHTHGLSIIGTVDDSLPGSDMREKIGTYEKAGWPNYVIDEKTGYPKDVNVSKRLAVFFTNFPDYYETFRPKLDRQFVPAVQNEAEKYIANKEYANVPGALLRGGILPRDEAEGVHAVDDMVVQAQGPGAEAVYGYIDNTDIFHIMADVFGVKPQ